MIKEKDYQKLKKIIQEETKEQKVSLWGKPYKFKPEMLSEKFGKADTLYFISTMDVRPFYWLFLADDYDDYGSNDDEFQELIDDVITAIQEEFGDCNEDTCDGECDCEYPTWVNVTGGISWDKVK